MAKRLEDVKTPVGTEPLFVALWRAWVNMLEEMPTRDGVLLLVAHWALETGWGKSMHCYNLGNIKSREGDGRDFCFFACGEEVSLAQAEKWVKEAPGLVEIKRRYADGNGSARASVWVKPDHPACRFRAYETLDEGAVDYLLLLRRRFSKAWPFVLAGDPVGFVHAIKQQGYFTASEATYAASVRTIFSGLRAKLHVDTESLPVLSEAEARRTLSLVATNLRELADEVLWPVSREDERKDDE